uniref:UDP-glucose flavonoid 3-O-glucosyltransferase 6 n=1 Tax=Fragaria ananassa TaxID=3747 RepID=UFOG6_FRAAN|nr:RecName: Full=UDP-glucose flavonoid 3-O-glucosyltransferase 6; AltName: Full=Flavonol 3-O-glucosyltransferase 6; Short=FaGT6 [Fragaria x ananassa]ABB92748.1 UDP-glucose glucosyltransferase [Fragaria x ananassa]
MKKASELIFIPIPGIGHIVSTVEIAKLLLCRDDNLFITILIMKFPFTADGSDVYIKSLAVDPSLKTQRIRFVNLPQEHFQGTGATGFFTFIDSHKSHVKDAVTRLMETKSETTRIAGFVIDMFCTGMIDLANEFGLPSYVFYTSGAADLGLMFHLQALRDEENKDCTEFKDSDAELVVSSFVNPLPAARVLPSVVFEKEGGNFFLNFAKRYRETKGILVNTFLELEPHAIQSLSSDGKILPVYPVGPILNVKSEGNQVSSEKSKQKSDILEWLDDQPPSSVVFLCFGSMGCFGEDQVKEIAHALEQGGIRFLWSLRQPSKEKIGFPSDYTDYKAVLPEGFLDRTTDLGKVIGWAPQLAILAHPAVGGFVSHCGWNSTLESIWYGVPIATWPFYAEQQVNAFELVKELKLAVEIDMGYRKDSGVIVSRENIEKGIKEVMEQESELRKRVKEMSQMSRKALEEDGSSYSSLGRFLDQIQTS